MSFLSLSPGLLLSSAGLGPLLHLLVWIHGDWDGDFYLVLFSGLILHTIIAHSLTLLQGPDGLWHYVSALTSVTMELLYVELVYLFSTMTSITLYRLIFHRLTRAGIPGPLLSRVTIFHRVYLTLRSKHRHAIVLQTLHQQYGDLVRVGPNHISVLSASSIDEIHGKGSRCTKGTAYENPTGTCVNWDRNVISHAERRRVWDRALGTEARGQYFGRILSLTNLLVEKLADSYQHDVTEKMPSLGSKAASCEPVQTRPTRVSEHIHRFAFDIMGALCYSTEFGYAQLLNNATHPMIAVIQRYMQLGVYVTMVPWLYCIVGRMWVPDFIAIKWDWIFFDFARSELERRQALRQDVLLNSENCKEKEVSIMSYLLSDEHAERHQMRKLKFKEVVADVLIMTVGGSDTTNSALVHSMYRLAKHQDVQETIYEELGRCWEPGTQLELCTLSNLNYLSAFINEVLRLHPPAASGLPRVVPHGGLTIHGTFIPEGTNLITPTYALQRDERYFEAGEKFLPERWLGQRYLVKDARAFLPFGIGTYGCPGKQLALMEMKIVLASIVRELRIGIPPGIQAKDLEEHVESEWKDCLTTQPAELELLVTRRRQI